MSSLKTLKLLKRYIIMKKRKNLFAKLRFLNLKLQINKYRLKLK
jgi:hypothetical protein